MSGASPAGSRGGPGARRRAAPAPGPGTAGSRVYQELDFTGLALDRLSRALRRTIDRHDMLRASFLPDGRQRVLPAVPPYQIPVFDLAGLPEAAREEALLAIRAP